MGRTVLIVDDDLATCNLLQESLQKIGYLAETARTSTHALKMAERATYDLIFLNTHMPQISGFEIFACILKGDVNRNTPVIMVSGHSDHDSVLHAMEMGAVDFVVKPWDSATLLHKATRWGNRAVEANWEHLEPEQTNVLKLTLATLDHSHEAVVKNKPLPYDEIRQTSADLLKVLKADKVGPVLASLKEHDSYTFVHSMRVGIFLSLFARNFGGFAEDDVQVVTEGGVVHDVGKAKTPLKILNKPGSFEPTEWEEMKNHVKHTVEALQRTPNVPAPVMEIAYCHHEKLDGTGYPRGLLEKDVGVLARMASIVDAYVALTDRRVYKPGFSHEKTFGILESATTHFDNTLVGEFRQMIESGGYTH